MAGVRLSDIAQQLGLNISTVSRALRDDPRVQGPTRQRVQAAAEALGYRPHLGARALAEGRSRTLWFILPELESAVEREPAAFAGRWLLDRGYDLFLALHHSDERVYARIVDRLVQGGADGAIVLPGNAAGPSAADHRLVASGLPFVYLDRSVPGIDAPVVTSDNEALAAGLVDRLAAQASARGLRIEAVVDGFPADRNPVEAARSRGLHRAAADRGWSVVGVADRGPHRLWVGTGSDQAEVALAQGALGVGVFDGWPGRRPEALWAVARQDFRAMAETAARVVLERLGELEPTSAGLMVPGAGYEGP